MVKIQVEWVNPRRYAEQEEGYKKRIREFRLDWRRRPDRNVLIGASIEANGDFLVAKPVD